MPATAYTANLIAKALAHGTAYQGPDGVFLALTTSVPTRIVAGTEVTLGDYARTAFSMASDFADDGVGKLTTNKDVLFNEATANYDDDVLAVEAYTLAAGGTRLWFIVLQSPQVVVQGMTPKFFTGDLVLQVI